MTEYKSGDAFRRALEDRLRSLSLNSNVPLVRLRKTVAFDRFLARLEKFQSGIWILKGGFAIQLRLVDKSRTTKDIDILVLSEEPNILSSLRDAGKIDLGDWFQFEIENNEVQPHHGFGGLRFPIRALLDGRTFESFHIDVGVGDPLVELPEELEIPPLMAFAEFPPTRILCYPITQQIAEKVHAYTRPHDSGESSRVKDFVDILLLAALSNIDAKKLHLAINATFYTRKTHSIPKSIPNPPFEWSKSFQKMAREVSLSYQSIDEAAEAFKQFLNPILSDTEFHQWDSSDWLWK